MDDMVLGMVRCNGGIIMDGINMNDDFPQQGWIYKTNIWQNVQSYGIAIPVSTKDGWKMIDTYQIAPGEATIDERIFQYADGEDHSRIIEEANNCHFYKATSNYDANDFTPWFKLDEYRRAVGDEEDTFRDEDVVHNVHLYREQGGVYNWNNGVAYVRKDGKVDPYKKLKNDIDTFYEQMNFPRPAYNSTILRELDEIKDKTEEIKALLELQYKLVQQEEEIKPLFEKFYLTRK